MLLDCCFTDALLMLYCCSKRLRTNLRPLKTTTPLALSIGTHFPCFAGTKAQILTPRGLLFFCQFFIEQKYSLRHFDSWTAWCNKCHHAGHAAHMRCGCMYMLDIVYIYIYIYIYIYMRVIYIYIYIDIYYL